MDLLKDKAALVTGAGRGIGRQIALALAAEGARVVVNDAAVTPDGEPDGSGCAAAVCEEIASAGGEAVAHSGDVALPAEAEGAVAVAVERFGGIDILVNNAGLGRDAPLHRLGPEQWQRALDAQLSSAFYCLRAAAVPMKRAQSGAIVNTTGVGGLRGSFGQAHAAAAAAGVVGLTLTAAAELQKYNVRVNAVAPLAKTRLTEDLPLLAQVDTMGPECIAPAYVFLASGLSDGVTGVVVGAAGGKLSVFRVVETLGVLKEEAEGRWTPQEIAQHWTSIAKL